MLADEEIHNMFRQRIYAEYANDLEVLKILILRVKLFPRPIYLNSN